MNFLIEKKKKNKTIFIKKVMTVIIHIKMKMKQKLIKELVLFLI